MELDFSALIKFRITTPTESTDGNVGKYIRFNVRNTGGKPAEYCEAKLEIWNEDMESIPGVDPSILHWVRRYPLIYLEPDERYTPITINVKDNEFLDLIWIKGKELDGDLSEWWVETYSHRPVVLMDVPYFFKITVFSRNATPISKMLRFHWDGTWNGFNENCVELVP